VTEKFVVWSVLDDDGRFLSFDRNGPRFITCRLCRSTWCSRNEALAMMLKHGGARVVRFTRRMA